MAVDYIRRLIEQLGRLLARILAARKAGDTKGALQEVQLAYRNLLGLDPTTLRSLSDPMLDSLLSIAGSPDPDKVRVLAELLFQEGDILQETEGISPLVLATLSRSLRYHLELLAAKAPSDHEALALRADELLARLAAHPMEDRLLALAFRHHEARGRYAQAENCLYELNAADHPNLPVEKRAFFRRLLALDDEVLLRGDLPRGEIEEALKLLGEDARDTK